MGNASWIIVSAALMLGCSPEGPEGGELGASPRWDRDRLLDQTGPHGNCAEMVIPDGVRNGLILGPVQIGNPGETLDSVDLDLELIHPNSADVEVRLAYDADNDGEPDASAEMEFFRARCNDQEVLYACPQALNGRYHFGLEDAGEDPLEAFLGLPAGGRFYLTVADTLAQEIGTVHGWSVHGRCTDASNSRSHTRAGGL